MSIASAIQSGDVARVLFDVTKGKHPLRALNTVCTLASKELKEALLPGLAELGSAAAIVKLATSSLMPPFQFHASFPSIAAAWLKGTATSQDYCAVFRSPEGPELLRTFLQEAPSRVGSDILSTCPDMAKQLTASEWQTFFHKLAEDGRAMSRSALFSQCVGMRWIPAAHAADLVRALRPVLGRAVGGVVQSLKLLDRFPDIVSRIPMPLPPQLCVVVVNNPSSLEFARQVLARQNVVGIDQVWTLLLCF